MSMCTNPIYPPPWVRQELTRFANTGDGLVPLSWAADMFGLTVTGLVKRARKLGIGQEIDAQNRTGKRWSLTVADYLRLLEIGDPPRGNPLWLGVPGAASQDGVKGNRVAAELRRNLYSH